MERIEKFEEVKQIPFEEALKSGITKYIDDSVDEDYKIEVLNLTINDVLNITRGNANNTLRIDGESGDHVHMSSEFTPGTSSGGYTTFTANTFTIEVKDELVF